MDYLRNIGLVSPSESVLAISVRDPGGNIVEAYRPNGRRDLPLTRMARTATQGQAGMGVAAPVSDTVVTQRLRTANGGREDE